ncbi:tetraacyldisaccharide 4'-kinase [uncultured Oxalicibacterium sp.]|uniref:tetraacyldisaccharide 4'-kinase n=1 Tax=uncultured Oxalicibacterium sp. TaxID=1168540 RepID=UPI0025DF0BB0|nr:tetraacyldisaccharide 4'-kinase [uncultured Oxalicibacterium sp.]
MRRGVFAHAMLPLACLFGRIAASRRQRDLAESAESGKLPVPVVVVGNIFVGGTGKTPLTIWLVQALRDAGFHPGVISRGYGADNTVIKTVAPDALPSKVGDEPLLIAQRAACPVVVGRDRVAAARALLAAHPFVDVIISDDGLQHYRLARDIEIILFDRRGVGNGWLLPAGPLREPASRPRDFTVINGGLPAPGVPDHAITMQLHGAFAERLSDSQQRQPLAAFAAIPSLLAAAGIGNPARFFDMLQASGLQFERLPLPDHHDFATNPFADSQTEVILITEKDAVKCRQHETLKNDPRIWVVPVTAQIEGAFAERIVEKLRGHSIA